MKKVEPSSTSVLWRTDPRAVGSVSFVITLKFGHYPLTAICAKAEISIYIGTPSKTASDTFWHDFSFLHSHFFTIIRIQRNWQRNSPSYTSYSGKKGWFLRRKGGFWQEVKSQSSTYKCILYIRQHIFFAFCKNISSALSNRQGGGKEEKGIQSIRERGEREVAVVLVWLRNSD